MEVKLMLSKKQMTALAGLAQEPDRQRMNRLFLDLRAGRSVDTVTCVECGEMFARQITDRDPTCSAECEKKRAVAATRQSTTTSAWKPINHLSR